jgi:hypothetical protein
LVIKETGGQNFVTKTAPGRQCLVTRAAGTPVLITSATKRK